MKYFLPLMIHWLPSRTAVDLIAVASPPASGSVSSIGLLISPLRIRGRYVDFYSAVPAANRTAEATSAISELPVSGRTYRKTQLLRDFDVEDEVPAQNTLLPRNAGTQNSVLASLAPKCLVQTSLRRLSLVARLKLF